MMRDCSLAGRSGVCLPPSCSTSANIVHVCSGHQLQVSNSVLRLPATSASHFILGSRSNGIPWTRGGVCEASASNVYTTGQADSETRIRLEHTCSKIRLIRARQVAGGLVAGPGGRQGALVPEMANTTPHMPAVLSTDENSTDTLWQAPQKRIQTHGDLDRCAPFPPSRVLLFLVPCFLLLWSSTRYAGPLEKPLSDMIVHVNYLLKGVTVCLRDFVRAHCHIFVRCSRCVSKLGLWKNLYRVL